MKTINLLGIKFSVETQKTPGTRLVKAFRLPIIALAIVIIAKAIEMPSVAPIGILFTLLLWGILFLIHNKSAILATIKKVVTNAWFLRAVSLALTLAIAHFAA